MVVKRSFRKIWIPSQFSLFCVCRESERHQQATFRVESVPYSRNQREVRNGLLIRQGFGHDRSTRPTRSRGVFSISVRPSTHRQRNLVPLQTRPAQHSVSVEPHRPSRQIQQGSVFDGEFVERTGESFVSILRYVLGGIQTLDWL